MPHRKLTDMLIIHQSDSTFGDAAAIDRWHKQRGWKSIGYHFVILNGHRTYKQPYNESQDGLIEKGRPIMEIGAHARGANHRSIGICLIGKGDALPIRKLGRGGQGLEKATCPPNKFPACAGKFGRRVSWGGICRDGPERANASRGSHEIMEESVGRESILPQAKSKGYMTQKQWQALKSLCRKLIQQFNIKIQNIKGHREINKERTCPGFDVSILRWELKEGL